MVNYAHLSYVVIPALQSNDQTFLSFTVIDYNTTMILSCLLIDLEGLVLLRSA